MRPGGTFRAAPTTAKTCLACSTTRSTSCSGSCQPRGGSKGTVQVGAGGGGGKHRSDRQTGRRPRITRAPLRYQPSPVTQSRTQTDVQTGGPAWRAGGAPLPLPAPMRIRAKVDAAGYSPGGECSSRRCCCRRGRAPALENRRNAVHCVAAAAKGVPATLQRHVVMHGWLAHAAEAATLLELACRRPRAPPGRCVSRRDCRRSPWGRAGGCGRQLGVVATGTHRPAGKEGRDTPRHAVQPAPHATAGIDRDSPTGKPLKSARSGGLASIARPRQWRATRARARRRRFVVGLLFFRVFGREGDTAGQPRPALPVLMFEGCRAGPRPPLRRLCTRRAKSLAIASPPPRPEINCLHERGSSGEWAARCDDAPSLGMPTGGRGRKGGRVSQAFLVMRAKRPNQLGTSNVAGPCLQGDAVKHVQLPCSLARLTGAWRTGQ